MAIKYYLTKCNIKSSSNYGKYYARTLRGNEVTLADLEREIEHACSATRGDVKLVLQTFCDIWKRHLQQGHTVNLDAMELGRHYISVRSRMVDHPEQFSTRNHILGFCLRSLPTGHRISGSGHHIQRVVTKGCTAEQWKSCGGDLG